jgi:hypothetical protein
MTRLESLMAMLVNLFTGFYKVTFGGTNKNTIVVGASPAVAVNGDWCAVQILTSTGTISSITIDNAVYTSLSGITFNQGVMIYGKISSITVPLNTTVICYGALTVTN